MSDIQWSQEARELELGPSPEFPLEEVDEHKCYKCGGPNTSWAAPSPLWNEVMRGGDIRNKDQYKGIVCPTCFMLLAEEMGVTGSLWKVYSERVLVPLIVQTPSGSVWNQKKWRWQNPGPWHRFKTWIGNVIESRRLRKQCFHHDHLDGKSYVGRGTIIDYRKLYSCTKCGKVWII